MVATLAATGTEPEVTGNGHDAQRPPGPHPVALSLGHVTVTVSIAVELTAAGAAAIARDPEAAAGGRPWAPYY